MRWQTQLSFDPRSAMREQRDSVDDSVQSSAWSQASSGDDDDPNKSSHMESGVRKRSTASISRLRKWQQSMKRCPRNGAVGNTMSSLGHCAWLPHATVQEFHWAGDTAASLRIRRELRLQPDQRSQSVEVDMLDTIKAIVTRTEEDYGTVREHFSVVRLDRDRPEFILRQVTTPLGDDALGQEGHASSFGDPSAVADLLDVAAERSGSSASMLVQALQTVQGDDRLVHRAVAHLESITA